MKWCSVRKLNIAAIVLAATVIKISSAEVIPNSGLQITSTAPTGAEVRDIESPLAR